MLLMARTMYSGPMYKSMKINNDKVAISFLHIGRGLEARSVLLDTYKAGGDSIKGFAICGPDRKFVWADALIKGDTVVVSSPKVKKPVAVRYGWQNFPICNLYNKEGFPAVPFRTDKFEPNKDEIEAAKKKVAEMRRKRRKSQRKKKK